MMYFKFVYLLVFFTCAEFASSVKLIDRFEIRQKIENNKLMHCAFLKETGSWVASAHYEASYNTTGWDVFESLTSESAPDVLQAYAAGVLEGGLTWRAIYVYYYNNFGDYCKGKKKLCKKIYKFIDENMKWVKKMIKKNAGTNSTWHQISLIYSQIQGIYDGYSRYCDNVTMQLSYRDIFMINIQEDLEDVVEVLGGYDLPAKVRGLDHCSGLIKLLPDNKDILIGHNAWTRYQSMVRMQKKYNHYYHKNSTTLETVPGISMAFSGYPGTVSSIDDYYVLSSKLVALETTIGNTNTSLWAEVKPTGQVFESVRSVVANRLAYDGQSWGKVFSRYNSGTYNNQWMIIDLNKFKVGSVPEKGLLHILEQIPGYIRFEDQTLLLINQTYWPSYNVPFYKDVFKMSGNEELVNKYGDWFTYGKTARALIFKRDHSKVKDVDSLLAFLRENNYQNDPYAKCNCTPSYNGKGAVAARSDLNPANGTYPFPALNHQAYGAIDAKATSLEMILKSQFKAVCGPTTGSNLPVFKWSLSDFNDKVPHLGQPDSFTFDPVITNWIYNVTLS